MKKKAILIGNNKYIYQDMNLDYAIADANDLGDKLAKLGFETDILINADFHAMNNGMVDFSRDLDQYDVGLFYFAGHGFQVNSNNYLGCTDSSFEDSGSIKFTCFPLNTIIETMEESKLHIKILIVDACRKGLPGDRGSISGFAPIAAPQGTIICFGTSPGQGAKEKNGHGLYTNALLQFIDTKNITIEELFKRVRNKVYIDSNKEQITWEHTSLLGDFKFCDDSSLQNNGYSKYALADSNYEPEKNGLCAKLIPLAKSHNYFSQNKIPNLFFTNISQLEHETADDLFVLGRNLYQSSDDAFEIAHSFFDLFVQCLSTLPVSVANHLLCGMAYELYFDSNGKMRRFPKTSNYYLKIHEALLNTEYQDALNFIVSQLKANSQQVVYIPNEKMELLIYLEEFENHDTGKKEYVVTSIELDGLNIMYNSQGDSYYDVNEDESYGGSYSMLQHEMLMRQLFGGTKRGLSID